MKEPKKKKSLNIDIGSRIQKCRKTKGLTQEQMAEGMDVSVQYISDLERGVTGGSVSTIIRICQLLETSADYILLGRQENMTARLSGRLESHSDAQKEQVLQILWEIDVFAQLGTN
ncbi:helix-turn-helix domain-containing protein [uncultured Faecalibaculum sp.]|uniref:helix-turn-helix domain-containing protein n=1 Tax=uncultured Faecalibaculum sp. TaxID=1729681 RepID=UPI002623CCC9|nr:helix-turn-helix transcriptional regulator [uncultured Faecalibaculum sp.]